jgi:hypothetical protein
MPIKPEAINQSRYTYNAYTQQQTTSSKPREAEPSLHATPSAASTNSSPSVSEAFFRNAGATLKGATLGFANLMADPVRKLWNYTKEGTPQALAVAGGTVALGYGVVVAAGAGTLFPLVATGLALGAGVQILRGGYGAFFAENPKDQLKGFERIGQAVTLSALAGVSVLHYKQFWQKPELIKLFPELGEGIKDIGTKWFDFGKKIPEKTKETWTKVSDWATGIQQKSVEFWNNLKEPKSMS